MRQNKNTHHGNQNMAHAKLYHNPRCSKSRQALEFLNEQSIDFEIVLYLKNVPTQDELLQLFHALNIENALAMIRLKEPEFKLANLSTNSSLDECLKAIETYPKLLERPIFLCKGKAAIGRPLDNIKALLNA